jgi:RNA polymerase sigma-70 factor (ECF subfamily)
MLFIKSGKKEISDEELLNQYRLSEETGIIGQLFSRHMHLVYGVCLKYLKNRDEAQDAVMSIFEKLLKEIPRHKIENFRNWLHVVTRNYCLMHLRSEKSKDEKFIDWMNDPVIFMESSSVQHPIDDDNQKIEEDLMDCIERLRDEQKECIRNFYFNNKCYKEIADEMNINEKKVKSYLQNAKRNLKLCLDEKNAEEKQTY